MSNTQNNEGCLGAFIIGIVIIGFWSFVLTRYSFFSRDDAKSYDTAAIKVKNDMTELEGNFQAFSQRKQQFETVDRAITKAREINAGLITDCDAILTSWDTKVKDSLGSHKQALELRSIRFKELAVQWYKKADEVTTPVIRANYIDNARTCELLASQSEIRFKQIYGAAVGEKSQADVLAERVAFIRSLRTVHLDWKTTLDEWPDTFDEAGIQNYFDAIGEHLKKMDGFQGLMRELIIKLEEETPPQATKQVNPGPISFNLKRNSYLS